MAAPGVRGHTGAMATAVGLGRVRSDIDVVSRAGLALSEFIDEATSSLDTVVPSVAGCVATLDPATAMVATVRKVGALTGRNEGDLAWAQLEYGGDDPTAMRRIHSSGTIAVGMHDVTGGEVERSPRMAQLMRPEFGFQDEARVVFADRNGAWGTLSLFRDDDRVFSPEEVAFLADLAPAFTRGIRAGLVAQLGRVDARPLGPGVVIVDAQDRIAQTTPGAESFLARMAAGMSDPMMSVHALVTHARRFARGDLEQTPRIRARTSDGVWLVLHAAPLGGTAERTGDVVVTIEEARPQEVIDIVAAAFGLTAREREVVAIVLRGADTREIAGEMHVSPYTVQDHLKSVFEKAGVTSRRELVARVYFDHYLPRTGGDLGANGWFSGVA